MNDNQYPWLILVPMREDIEEFHDLTVRDQATLWQEISLANRSLHQMTGAKKMNVAALGNMVPQLHIHVVARFKRDPAWPNPVWGCVEPIPYEPSEISSFANAFLKQSL